MQDEDTIKKQEKVLKTKLANPAKEELAHKKRAKAEARVHRLRASVAAKEKAARNALEEKMYSVKPLDDLKERICKLQLEREQAQGVLEAETSSSDQAEAARERVAEMDDEIARLQTHI